MIVSYIEDLKEETSIDVELLKVLYIMFYDVVDLSQELYHILKISCKY